MSAADSAKAGNGTSDAARGADLKGIPTVTDADTVVISGSPIRLDGIDAPESDQTCLDKNGEEWNCGIAARGALVKQFGSREWKCRTTGRKTSFAASSGA